MNRTEMMALYLALIAHDASRVTRLPLARQATSNETGLLVLKAKLNVNPGADERAGHQLL